jgi:hypothetical protein
MEKGVLDVELMERTTRLDNEAEGLVIVHSGALGETLKDPAGLVAFEGAVRSQLVVPGDHIGARRTRQQVPGVVGQQGRVLLLHGPTPVRVSEGSADGGGDWGGVRWSSGHISGQDQPVD